jgi:hypothetical protein
MKADVILNYLAEISNKNTNINLIIHVIILVALICFSLIKKDKIKYLIANSTILILSLSIVVHAFIYGNPFHLITFIVLAAGTLLALYKGRDEKNIKFDAFSVISLIIIGMGFWYPEFVSTSTLGYFMYSPVGIVPCPTLLVILGLLTLLYPRINKAHYITAVLMGFIYGIIGTFVLKVSLDISLLLVATYALLILFISKDSQNK